MQTLLWIIAILIIAEILAKLAIWYFYERKGKIVVWVPWLELSIEASLFLFWFIELIIALKEGSNYLWLDILVPVLWLLVCIFNYKRCKEQYKKNKQKVEESEANS